MRLPHHDIPRLLDILRRWVRACVRACVFWGGVSRVRCDVCVAIRISRAVSPS